MTKPWLPLSTFCALLSAAGCSSFSSGAGADGGVDGATSQSADAATANPERDGGSHPSETPPAPTTPATDAASPSPGIDAAFPPPSPDAAVAPPSADGAPPSRVDASSPVVVPPVGVDAAPEPEKPTGCQIVACGGVASNHSCCHVWFAFGLDSEDRQQAHLDDLVTAFSRDTDVKASYKFQRAKQDGAVAFLFDNPRALKSLKITSTFGGAAGTKPFITTEGDEGKAGCAYPLGAGGQADLGDPLFCWGGAFTPDRISIRMEAEKAGVATLAVTGVQLQ